MKYKDIEEIISKCVPPKMGHCKPPCKHKVEIIIAHDGVYDVWIDGTWMFTRGSYKNVLAELEKLFSIFEGDRDEH